MGEITRRTRGRRVEFTAKELRDFLLGWKAYFGVTEIIYPLKELDSWLKRKLRCYLWKQWGRGGYKELRKRGVSRDLAWNTWKSAHGPWRLSRSRGWPLHCQAVTLLHLGSRDYLSKDHLNRTALVRDPYASRRSRLVGSGVGGGESRGSPLSRLGLWHEII